MPHKTADRFDVVVIGAGVIGCAAARAAADAGLQVLVLDRGDPGHEASSAAAGLLAPQYEALTIESPEGSSDADPLFNLCHRSRALYPDFASALREETGIDVELRREGTLVLALSDEDERRLDEQLSRQRAAGLAVSRVEADRLRKLEPLASPDARWALSLPQDIQVENVRLCQALVRSLHDRGVQVRSGDPAIALEVRSSRLEAVRTASGERAVCDRAVVAAGAWSGTIGGLPRPLPVGPARGQMLELREVDPLPHRILASGRGCYLVPRLDGRLLVGSTVEYAGFSSDVTAGGIRDILDRALEIAPQIITAPVSRVWAGLRPVTPDELPILGPDPDVPAIIYATGHFRNGILLAPITAQIIAELLADGTSTVALSSFRPERFGVPCA